MATAKPRHRKLARRLQAGASPAFHDQNEYEFQNMCRDLLDTEPSVANAMLYGTRGQSQYGIDLLAQRSDGDGIEVGQCKGYQGFTASQIRAASNEFLVTHWTHWSSKSVKRFILFLACELNKPAQIDTVTEEEARFRAIGVRYEAWGADQIVDRLRPHRAITARYLPPDWVEDICGPVLIAPPSVAPSHSVGSAAVLGALLGQVERLGTFVSQRVADEFTRMREAVREGRPSEAHAWLTQLKTDVDLWRSLGPEVQAKLVRLEAGLELALRCDIARATQLADEATRLAPGVGDARLRAVIALHELGAEAALPLLAEQRDLDSLNTRALMELVLERADTCRATLDRIEAELVPDAETLRLRGLVALVSGGITQARLAVEKALELSPHWESVRFTAASIDYFSALSPAAMPRHLVAWPEPVDWDLIKRDDASRDRLKAAADVFRALAEHPGRARDERQAFETWRLACLANDQDRQDEAADYCRSLIAADPSDYRAITWAIARRYDVALQPSEVALKKLAAPAAASIPHVLALAARYLTTGRTKKAIDLLHRTRPAFAEHPDLWAGWTARAQALAGSAKAAAAALATSDATADQRQTRTAVLLALARQRGTWRPLLAHLEESYRVTGNAGFLLDRCQVAAQRGEWGWIADRADELVAAVATADAVELAASAAFQAARHALCLRLLDAHRQTTGGGRLPLRLRRLRADCARALGLLPEAIAEARALVDDDPSTSQTSPYDA